MSENKKSRRLPKNPDADKELDISLRNPEHPATQSRQKVKANPKKRRKPDEEDEKIASSSANRGFDSGPEEGIPTGTRKLPPLRKQSALTTSEGGEAVHTPIKKKKKKRIVKKVISSPEVLDGLGLTLADIADDIKEPDQEAEMEQTESKSKTTTQQNMLKSQPVDRLYIEQHRGFKSADKTKIERELYEDEQRAQDENKDFEPAVMSSTSFAITTSRVKQTLIHYCMGILAGLMIWQTIYIYSFTQLSTEVFINIYQYMSLPINSIFYLLLVLCTVGIFDRYDVAKVSRKCLQKACTCQSGAVLTSLLFLTALCLNTSMSRTSDKFKTYLVDGIVNATNRTFWITEEEREQEIMIWKISSIARAALTGLGWFVISIKPATHRLQKHLKLSEKQWSGSSDSVRNIS